MLNGIRNRLAGVLATQPASPAGLRPPTGLGRPLVVNEKIALDARKFLRGLTPQRISSVFDSADRGTVAPQHRPCTQTPPALSEALPP